MGIETIALIVGAAAAAGSAYQANEQGKDAQKAAKKQARDQEQATNKLNGKTPDLGAMMATNALDANAGPSGTLLTGPQGVDPSRLLLGKSVLLGGG